MGGGGFLITALKQITAPTQCNKGAENSANFTVAFSRFFTFLAIFLACFGLLRCVSGDLNSGTQVKLAEFSSPYAVGKKLNNLQSVIEESKWRGVFAGFLVDCRLQADFCRNSVQNRPKHNR